MSENQFTTEIFDGSSFKEAHAAAMVRETIKGLGENLAYADLEHEVFQYFTELDVQRFEIGGDQYFNAIETLAITEVNEKGDKTTKNVRQKVLIRDDRERLDIDQDFTVMFPKFHGLNRWAQQEPDVLKGYADATIHDQRSLLFSLIHEH